MTPYSRTQARICRQVSESSMDGNSWYTCAQPRSWNTSTNSVAPMALPKADCSAMLRQCLGASSTAGTSMAVTGTLMLAVRPKASSPHSEGIRR